MEPGPDEPEQSSTEQLQIKKDDLRDMIREANDTILVNIKSGMRYILNEIKDLNAFADHALELPRTYYGKH